MLRLILFTLSLAGGIYLISASAQQPSTWQQSSSDPPMGTDSSDRLAHSVEQQYIYAAGIVEGRQQTILLDFEIEGRLQMLLVEEGQRVTAGAPLATLDATAWQTQVAQATARLHVAQAQFRQAEAATREETQQVARAEVAVSEVLLQQRQREMTRADALRERKALTQQQWDDAHYQLAQAKARLELAQARLAEVSAPARDSDLAVMEAGVRLAEAELNNVRAMLNKNTLVAPIDGVILDVAAEPGDLVGPNRNTPLIRMANVQQLRVRAHVEELDALDLQPGQPAWITADGSRNVRWSGIVIACAPLLSPKRVLHHHPGERVDTTVREAVIQLDNPEQLIVGLPVDVYIEPASVEKHESFEPPRLHDVSVEQSAALPDKETR